MKSKGLGFQKYEAAGNDFLFFKQEEAESLTQLNLVLAQACHRQKGIGADGAVILKKENKGYVWDFYNADGSVAEFCGNAARCVGRYLKENGLPLPAEVKTLAGIFFSDQAVEGFSAALKAPVTEVKSGVFEADGEAWSFSLINAGVPHAVIEISDIKKAFEKKSLAQKLRRSEAVGLAGANVTFVARTERGLEAVSFERGVEDFTLGCGSGAVAATFFMGQGKATREIIKMPGGDINVEISERGEPTLTSKVRFIGEGTYFLEENKK